MNADISSLRAIVKGEVPQSDISKLLYKHKCLFLLSKTTDNKCEKKLTLDMALNKASIKERFKACAPIFKIFADKGIRYAVIKGAVLSKAAYGDVSYRSSADIDLLIKRSDVDLVKKTMLENGYIQGRIIDNIIVPYTRQELIFQSSISHQTAPFVKVTQNPICPFIKVDVNIDIIWGESKEKPDMNYVLDKTDEAQIYSVKFSKLKTEMEFISLCLHHYKDMNSLYMLYNNKFNINLFSDIYFYLKNQKPDTKTLLLMASRLEVTKYIYYCVYYTQLLFDDPSLDNYINLLYSNDAIKLLDTYGLDDREIKTWDIDFFERLFMNDIRSYLSLYMSDSDNEKIALNSQYM